jgi:hypothetical protein
VKYFSGEIEREERTSEKRRRKKGERANRQIPSIDDADCGECTDLRKKA